MLHFLKVKILPLLIIAVLCVGTVEGFYYLVDHKFKESTKKRRKLAAEAAVSGDHQSIKKGAVGKIDTTVIIRRNLFSSDLSPGMFMDTDPLAGVEKSSLDLVLMGTITGTDGNEKAIIYDKLEKKQELYRTGDYIQQAIIKSILRGKVILNVNGTDEMLDIKEARNSFFAGGTKGEVSALPSKEIIRQLTKRPDEKEYTTSQQAGLLRPGSVSIEKLNKLKSFRGGVIVNDRSTAE